MLKFGQLYLDHGKWHGKQLIPEKWVAASVAPSPAFSQYGLMWWMAATPTGDSANAAMGLGGQLIVVVPKHRLVVAVASQPTKDYATDSEELGQPSRISTGVEVQNIRAQTPAAIETSARP